MKAISIPFPLRSVAIPLIMLLLAGAALGIAKAGSSNNQLDVNVTLTESEYEPTDSVDISINMSSDQEPDLWIAYEECLFTISLQSAEANADGTYDYSSSQSFECVEEEEETTDDTDDTTDTTDGATDDTTTDDTDATEEEMTEEEMIEQEMEEQNVRFVLEEKDTIAFEGSLPFENIATGSYVVTVDFHADVIDAYYGTTTQISSYEATVGVYDELAITVSTSESEYYADENVKATYTIVNNEAEGFSYDRECAQGPDFYIYDEDDDLVYSQVYTQECDWRRTTYIKSWTQYSETLTVYSPSDFGELPTGTYRLVLDLDQKDRDLTPETTFEVIQEEEVKEPETDEDDEEPTDSDTDMGENVENREMGDLNDIQGHWADEYIDALYFAYILDGYSDDSYRPNQAITRGELVEIMVNAMAVAGVEMPEDDGVNTFSDVVVTATYYEEVEAAAARGFIDGYSDGTFRPNNTITRAEAVAMILQAFELTNGDEDTVFSDVTEEWQINYVSRAYDLEIIEGYRDEEGNLTYTFGPDNELTRAEAAKIIFLAVIYL